MRKYLLFSWALLALSGAARGEFIGAELPLDQQASVDGWSGIPVLYGYELPPGEAVNIVRFYADENVPGTFDELYHVVPLIVRQEDGSLDGDGIFSVWEVGPAHTPTESGEQEFQWGSSPVPADGHLYHPAALQWQEGVNNNSGGVITFGSDGEGMHYFDVDSTDYIPNEDIGEVEPELVLSDLTIHSSAAGGRLYQLNFETGAPITGEQLQAGDADRDFDFDQLDLVAVQIAAKYLTGTAATWGEGDWDGAPGGSPDSPPPGDGSFDQLDIIAALNAGVYLTGPYNAVNPGGAEGDGQTSVGYDVSNGHVWVDAPAGVDLTSINIDSAGGIFTGDAAQNLGGSFDNDADNNIFKATFGSSFGSISFGNVAQPGLAEDLLLNDLTVVGSLAGGGDLGQVDLIYVPEPAAVVLLGVGLIGILGLLRGRRR